MIVFSLWYAFNFVRLQHARVYTLTFSPSMQLRPNPLRLPNAPRYPRSVIRELVRFPSPTALKSYALAHTSRRINEAGKIPIECVSMNRDLVRDHTFKMSDMDKLLERTVLIIPSPTLPVLLV